VRRVVSAPALRRGASLACLPLAAVGLLASPAVGAPSQQVPIGPRAIGMGGAFSAIADDATALFWNPAGLARLGHQELAGAHADLFGAGIKDDHAAFVLPLSPRDAAGIDWYHSGFDDGELGFGENRADVGYALELRRWLYAGAGAKLLTRSISLDGTEIRGGRGYGMDLGLLASPREHVWLGLAAQAALGTRLHYADGAPEEVYPRNLRIGGAYTAPRWGTAALDIDDRWHAGLELTPLQQLALRVGTQKDRNTGEPATWTYGFGLKAGALRFDYARVEAPALPATDHFGVAMEFNFNPALIRIERVETRDLYTSLYQTYAREPFGSVRVRSLQDRPLAARLSVFVPGLMDAPSDGEIILRPKATLDVPLTAVLSPAVLTQRGDRAVQVQVSASYQSRRVMRREKGSARCVAYAPGAIRWGLGVAQAAAWVTPQDPAVTALAREAARVVALQGLDPLGNRNLGFAAAITDALAQLELAYVPDPTNPYSRIGESEEAVDTIFYPYETLARHTGDCDDTTVLMASLLASVGVSTRFADAPGHIFLLIDTGLHERNRPALAVDDGMTVIADEEVWIPFETTAISRGFTEAWRIGSETYRSWSARGEIGQVDVTQAQARYAPALPPGERLPVHVDPERLAQDLARDARTVDGWRDAYYTSHFGGARRDLTASADALTEVAGVLFKAGELGEARTRLEQALRQDPRSVAAHNDLAVVLAGQDSLEAAEGHLRTLLAMGETHAGVRLNLGVALFADGDSLGAVDELAAGIAGAGGVDPASRLLGLVDGGASAEAEAPAVAEQQTRARLLAALRAAASPRAPGSRTPPSHGPRAGGPAPAGASRGRSLRLEGLQHCMYWKE